MNSSHEKIVEEARKALDDQKSIQKAKEESDKALSEVKKQQEIAQRELEETQWKEEAEQTMNLMKDSH